MRLESNKITQKIYIAAFFVHKKHLFKKTQLFLQHSSAIEPI